MHANLGEGMTRLGRIRLRRHWWRGGASHEEEGSRAGTQLVAVLVRGA